MEHALSRAGILPSKDFLPRFLILILIFLAVVLVGYAELNHRDFLDHQKQLAAKETQGAAILIERFIAETRRNVALFAQEQRLLISKLALNPEDEDLYNHLFAKIKAYFPNAFTFSIANVYGEVILADFEAKVDQACIIDICAFARDNMQPDIHIHPNPAGYHFDVMVSWSAPDSSKDGVFFVSFLSDVVNRILDQSQLVDHQLLILHRDIPGLIELTAVGPRNKIKREIYLNAAEQAAIVFEQPIPGTRWVLADLPFPGLIAAHSRRVRIQALIVFSVFSLMMLTMAYLLRREERGRSMAENALIESHRRLELGVKERTQDLMDVNKNLRNEMNERNKTQQALIESEERYSLAVGGANDAIWDWDIVNKRLYFSPRYTELVGEKTPALMAPGKWLRRLHLDDKPRVKAAAANIFNGKQDQLSIEYRLLGANGKYRWVLMRGAVVRAKEGKPLRMAGSLTDITERKQLEQRLVHDAFHDDLTGLPNRALLIDRIGQAIRMAARHEDYKFAVLFIDIDRFKQINDSYGHSVGDALLIQLSERINSVLRGDDTLARLGGDEFAVLLDRINQGREARLLADRILENLADSFKFEGHDIYVSVSIGIALSESGYKDAESILRDADVAMYQAKSRGKARIEMFDDRVRKDIIRRVNLENDLRRAIERHELHVHYQPVISLRQGRVSGFEALSRWQHPQRGEVVPNEFIPVAEETSLIMPIGEHVLKETCDQIPIWQDYSHHKEPLSVGINLSCKQFLQHDLLRNIEQILGQTQLTPPALNLTLEMTETVIMQNLKRAADIMGDMKALGLKLSIDDFGTGYSSLSYLQSLPLDTLKIDYCFVSRMHNHAESAEIVRAVIGLAHALELEVVAEGVENEEQLDMLRNMDCEYGQGFYFSKPLNGEQAAAFVDADRQW